MSCPQYSANSLCRKILKLTPKSSDGKPAIRCESIPQGAHWAASAPTRQGWYWWRSTSDGKRDEPGLIYCDPGVDHGAAEYLTENGVTLFLDDFATMNAEFWSDPVKSPPS
jgi:hypothetical protein